MAQTTMHAQQTKQKKFKGWKKALLRLVFPARAFASGSKKVSDAPAVRDLKATSTNTNATNFTHRLPPGLSGLRSTNEGDFSPSRSAATATSNQLYALAAPKLPLVSGLASSLSTSEHNPDFPSLSLSLPTPTIPTITITPTTPVSPTGANVNSAFVHANSTKEGEVYEKEGNSSVGPSLYSDYFNLAAVSEHAESAFVSALDQESSSTRDPQVASSSSVIQPSADFSPVETAVISDAPESLDEVETGDKKKNKKKKKKTKKGSSLNPTNLIGQAMEHSPNPLDVVKKGINTASSASANVGSIMNAGNNAVSTLVSSAPVSALGGATKLTDALPLKRKDFDLMIPIGPVAFVLKGHIERENLEIDAGLYVKVGFVTHKLGKVQGNLLTGVRIKFGLSGVLTGQARFYMPKGEKGKKTKGKGKDKENKGEGLSVVENEVVDEATATGERSKWLWLDIKVTVFKEDIGPLSLPLIPLRFGPSHQKNNSEALSVRSISISVLEDVEDASGQVTTVRRSIDVDTVGRPRRSTSITTTTHAATVTRKSIDYPHHHLNHLSQLEAFSFCSSSGVRRRKREPQFYGMPEFFFYEEEDEDWEVEEEGERARFGYMVGPHAQVE